MNYHWFKSTDHFIFVQIITYFGDGYNCENKLRLINSHYSYLAL